MKATKRIPVTEERWRELSELKEAGQTYDELLSDMIEVLKRERLFKDMREKIERQEFVPLEESGE